MQCPDLMWPMTVRPRSGDAVRVKKIRCARIIHGRQSRVRLVSAWISAGTAESPAKYEAFRISPETGEASQARCPVQRTSHNSPTGAAVDQMVKHSLIVLGEFEAFLDRTRRMIRLETEIPKASKYSANALSGRRGDISGEG